MPPNVLPFGQWPSPISIDLITTEASTFEDMIVDPIRENVYVVERRVLEEGRNALILCSGKDDRAIDVLDPRWDVKTFVHTYGGSAVAAHGGQIVFSHGEDNRLYILHTQTDEGSTALTPDNPAWRFGDIAPHPSVPLADLSVAVREDHTNPDPAHIVNSLVSISENGDVHILVEGADFYSDPRFSPDGSKIAWIQWYHPYMPFQSAELCVADFKCLRVENVRAVNSDGEKKNVVVQQPVWVSDATLVFLCDVSGFLNPWVYRLDLPSPPVPILASPLDEDFGEPGWYLGNSSMAPLDSDRLICVSVRNGISVIYCLTISTGNLVEIKSLYVHIQRVRSYREGSVVFLGRTNVEPDAVVLLTRKSESDSAPNFRVILTNEMSSKRSFSEEYISPGKPRVFSTEDSQLIHTIFYAPKNPDFKAPDGELPPCVIGIHGGPTDRAVAGFDCLRQIYTSRGFSWLDVNYRGTTGHGRKYTEQLDGEWGNLDVSDCIFAAREAAKAGLIDIERVIIRGNSAGGYTLLRSLILYPRFYKVGVCSYGLCDLEQVIKTTHKFQMKYLHRFLSEDGDPERVLEMCKERSPIFQAEKIQIPVLFFQGGADVVVLPVQSDRIVEAIRSCGGRVEYVLFEGEGHGWRRANTIRQALEKELRFVRDVLGLSVSAD